MHEHDPGLLITHERGPMSRQVLAAAGSDEARGALLARVSPACRSRFAAAPGYFEWVESALALELHQAWVQQQPDLSMAARGRETALGMLDGPQQWILRLASAAFLLENVPRLFRFYYRGGRPRLVRLERGHGELILEAEGYPEEWFREGIPAWLQAALELTGAKEVEVHHRLPTLDLPPCTHRYDLRWRDGRCATDPKT